LGGRPPERSPFFQSRDFKDVRFGLAQVCQIFLGTAGKIVPNGRKKPKGLKIDKMSVK
jgi:hypothetical protein